MKTYEKAERLLKRIQARHRVQVDLKRIPRDSKASRDEPNRFHFSVRVPGTSPAHGFHTGTYSAGVGLAESWADSLTERARWKLLGIRPGDWSHCRRARHGGGLTLDAESTLSRVYARWMPEESDVFCSLLHDARCTEGYDEGYQSEWLEDLGFLENAESLRRGLDAWHECQKTARFLRSVLGRDYQRALNLSAEL